MVLDTRDRQEYKVCEWEGIYKWNRRILELCQRETS